MVGHKHGYLTDGEFKDPEIEAPSKYLQMGSKVLLPRLYVMPNKLSHDLFDWLHFRTWLSFIKFIQLMVSVASRPTTEGDTYTIFWVNEQLLHAKKNIDHKIRNAKK